MNFLYHQSGLTVGPRLGGPGLSPRTLEKVSQICSKRSVKMFSLKFQNIEKLWNFRNFRAEFSIKQQNFQILNKFSQSRTNLHKITYTVSVRPRGRSERVGRRQGVYIFGVEVFQPKWPKVQCKFRFYAFFYYNVSGGCVFSLPIKTLGGLTRPMPIYEILDDFDNLWPKRLRLRYYSIK